MAPSATVHVRALDAIVPIVVSGGSPARVAAVSDRIRGAWSRCLVPAEPDADGVLAVSDPVTVTVTPGREDAILERLSSSVTRTGIVEAAGRHLMLHASALADPQSGLAVALVGPSGRGKTTASLTLAADLGFLAEETTAVGTDGGVRPYPRPLSIRRGAGVPKEQRSPDALGLRDAGPGPWPLGAIVLLDRRADHSGAPVVTRVPLAETLVALGPETSSLDRLEAPLQLVARLVDRRGPALRIRYAESADLLAPIRALLAARSSEREPTAPWATAVDASVPDDPARPMGASVRRATAVDAIDADGSLVVLRGGGS